MPHFQNLIAFDDLTTANWSRFVYDFLLRSIKEYKVVPRTV